MNKSVNKFTSEKDTDHLFLTKWTEIFGQKYNTKTNKELFNSLIPDGWQIINNILFIIENKKEYKDLNIAKEQLLKYLRLVKQNNKFEQFKNIYLIVGYGDEDINFNYKIYQYNSENKKLLKINLLLENIRDKMELKDDFDEREIHDFNQYLYDNGILLNKSQKTLFVASLLLALKVDSNFIINYDINKPGFIIADKIIELINKGYNDPIFTSQFKFIQKSLKNQYLYDLVKKLYIDIKKYGKDILNKFYSEFCKYDKNDDSKLGVVLTPHDIVELMVNELNIKETDTILDFCTGTGSFLLESGKYSKHLIGCEYNEERYALCKCNFILNDYDCKNVYYNSCFNQEFPKVNKSIINPPFSCNSSDENVEENITNWKSYNKEQRFLLYQAQCLKENGIGAAIIPRSNFNNTVKKTNEFKQELMKHIQILKIYNCNSKVFAPVASVECTIIIYRRIKSINKSYISKNVKIIDYTNDGYELKKKIRTKTSEPILTEQVRDLKFNDDWNYQKDFINNLPDINKLLTIENINKKYYEIINNINNGLYDNVITSDNIIKVKLSDLLEPIKLKTYKNEPGNYPLYGATKLNKPTGTSNNVSINTYTYDDLLVKMYGICCIGKTGNGGAGYLNVYKGEFAITSTVLPCKIKCKISKINLLFISIQLHQKFSRYNNFTNDSINTEINIILDKSKLLLPELRIESHNELIIKEWKQLKINEYFNVIKPLKIFQINKQTIGKIPLISSTSENNGISKYINDYSYDGECLSVARNGSVGSCFYQTGKIGITTDIILLQPKENNNIDLYIWALMLNYYLPQKYFYSNKLSIEKLLKEIINIPIFE